MEPIAGFDRFWLEIRAPYLDTEAETNLICDLLELGPGSRVLDAGCGPGRVSNALGRRGISVVGVDINPELIADAEKGKPASGVFYRVGNYAEAPDVGLTAVLSWHTSWGYEESESANLKALNTFYNVLAPGGKLLMQVWDPGELGYLAPTIHEVSSGEVIAEKLQFVSTQMKLHLSRWVLGLDGSAKFERGSCMVLDFSTMRALLEAQGFSAVERFPVPAGSPWYIIIATKSADIEPEEGSMEFSEEVATDADLGIPPPPGS